MAAFTKNINVVVFQIVSVERSAIPKVFTIENIISKNLLKLIP